MQNLEASVFKTNMVNQQKAERRITIADRFARSQSTNQGKMTVEDTVPMICEGGISSYGKTKKGNRKILLLSDSDSFVPSKRKKNQRSIKRRRRKGRKTGRWNQVVAPAAAPAAPAAAPAAVALTDLLRKRRRQQRRKGTMKGSLIAK